MFNQQLEFKFYDLYPEQIELPLSYPKQEVYISVDTPTGFTGATAIDSIDFGTITFNVADNEVAKITDYGLVLKQESGWLKTKVGNWLGINYEK